MKDSGPPFGYPGYQHSVTVAAVGKNDTGVRWLYSQLPELTAQGILTDESAAALRAHYGTPKTRMAVSLLIAVTAVLGSLLIGAGIILVLAANWDSFPRIVRTGLAFVPLLISQALGTFVLLRKSDAMGWREGAALLNTLAVAAAIALVSQIYHAGGDFSQFLLAWMFLMLPAIYVLRSAAATLLYLWLGIAWTLQTTAHNWTWGWLLAAAILPLAVPMIIRGGMRAWWLSIATLVTIGILLGVTAEHAHMRGIWIPAFAGYSALLYVTGVALRPDELHPFRWIGFAAIGILSLVFTYGAFWSFSPPEITSWRHTAASLICGLAGLMGIGAAAVGFARRVPVNPVAAAFPIATVLAYWVGFAAHHWTAALLMNLYVFALALTALRSGLAQGRFAETNAGMLLLTALIVMRFFDTDVGFLIRGLAFMAAGAGFLAVNIILLKRRKVEA
jgi:uncharacterized membrane protein